VSGWARAPSPGGCCGDTPDAARRPTETAISRHDTTNADSDLDAASVVKDDRQSANPSHRAIRIAGGGQR
jgi:hypothetical protein